MGSSFVPERYGPAIRMMSGLLSFMGCSLMAMPYVIAPISEITGMIVAADTKSKLLAPYAKFGITIAKAS